MKITGAGGALLGPCEGIFYPAEENLRGIVLGLAIQRHDYLGTL